MSSIKKQVYSKPFNLVFENNYPNLFVGPGFYNNYYSAKLSTPKQWVKDKDINNISNFRKKQEFTLKRYNKEDIRKENKNLEEMQLLTQSIKTTEMEIDFERKPRLVKEQFSGINNSSYQLNKFKISENIRVPRNIDKIVNDYDLKAKEGIINLYTKTKDIYKTQQLLSIGLLGLKNNRILVPTKWSITGCDDITSKEKILEKIRYYPEIDDFKIYNYSIYKNQFIILLLPSYWGFEVIEKQNENYMIDYELKDPKKKYASNVTGGYYASRLEVTNYLENIKKQAKVIIFRDIGKDYISQGVWIVREAIKETLKQKPILFNDIKSVINYLNNNYNSINVSDFIKKSNVIKEFKNQKSILNFIYK